MPGRTRTEKKQQRSIYSSRVEKEIALAGMRTLEFRKKKGELIEADFVRRALGNMVMNARKELLGIGNSLAQELAVESDPKKIRAAIDAAISAALLELSRWEPPKGGKS